MDPLEWFNGLTPEARKAAAENLFNQTLLSNQAAFLLNQPNNTTVPSFQNQNPFLSFFNNQFQLQRQLSSLQSIPLQPLGPNFALPTSSSFQVERPSVPQAIAAPDANSPLNLIPQSSTSTAPLAISNLENQPPTTSATISSEQFPSPQSQDTQPCPRKKPRTPSVSSMRSSTPLDSSTPLNREKSSKNRNPSTDQLTPVISSRTSHNLARLLEEIYLNSILTGSQPKYILVQLSKNESELNTILRIKSTLILKDSKGLSMLYPGFSFRKLKIKGRINHRTNVFEGDYKVKIMPKFCISYDLNSEAPRPEFPRATCSEHWYKFCASQVDTLLLDTSRPGDQTFIRNACNYFTNTIAKGRRDYINIDISEKEAILQAGEQVVIFLSNGFGSTPCKTINNIPLPADLITGINSNYSRMDLKCLRDRFTATLKKYSEPKEHQFYSLLANLASFYVGDYIIVSRRKGIYTFKARFVEMFEPSYTLPDRDELYETFIFYKSSNSTKQLIKKTFCTTIAQDEYDYFRQLINFFDYEKKGNEAINHSTAQKYFNFLIKPEPLLNFEDNSLENCLQPSARKPDSL